MAACSWEKQLAGVEWYRGVGTPNQPGASLIRSIYFCRTLGICWAVRSESCWCKPREKGKQGLLSLTCRSRFQVFNAATHMTFLLRLGGFSRTRAAPSTPPQRLIPRHETPLLLTTLCNVVRRQQRTDAWLTSWSATHRLCSGCIYVLTNGECDTPSVSNQEIVVFS